MKKSVLFLLALLTIPAWAVTVTVHGKTLATEPVLTGGRVLVPLRAVFQALEANVDYRNSTITATREGQTVVLKPNSSTAQVNGKAVTLDAPARLMGGTTYVPLRFVAQALGEEVAWHGSTQTVVLGEGVAQAPAPGSRVALDPILKRLVVGNQGGVLKVWDETASSVSYYRGLDDRSVAPLSAQDQDQILGTLQLSGKLDDVSRQLMNEYQTLPRQKEALALLGVLNSVPSDRIGTGSEIRSFLVDRMMSDPSVYNRRQATLALAVGSTVEPATVDAVVDFYQGSDNLWETFPVQQFFEYQAARVRTLPNYSQVRNETLSVNSLYRENIAAFLNN
ncbi:MAG: copper amine oxidase N-terminal domain-containing protein [Candidatus Eremiobacteraeota bacterium]|nr:copper amine oxidase N-terminal domain-containing protein [Candidatus Eremiobacteraeota bacterium]